MQLPLASIGDRFTAQFIDALIALVAGAFMYFVATAIGLPLEFCILVWLAYLLFCDGLPGGQSIGKRFTKSSVVHVETGRPCSYWQSCLRNACLIFLGLLDVVFIIGRQRRRLGDFLASTRVVRAVGQGTVS